MLTLRPLPAAGQSRAGSRDVAYPRIASDGGLVRSSSSVRCRVCCRRPGGRPEADVSLADQHWAPHGRDRGSLESDDYRPPFRFKRVMDHVTLEIPTRAPAHSTEDGDILSTASARIATE